MRHQLAEVLGRYSNLCSVAARIDHARAHAALNRRDEPWVSPDLNGVGRVRLLLEPHAEEIRARYEAGGTCLGLAREYGVPETTMRDFCGRIGIEMRPQGKVTPEDVAEMARLRENGWTYREIGEKFGVTRHAVAMRLKRQTAAGEGP